MCLQSPPVSVLILQGLRDSWILNQGGNEEEWEGNLAPVFRKPMVLHFIWFFYCSHSEKNADKLERMQKMQKRDVWSNTSGWGKCFAMRYSQSRLRDDFSSVLSAPTAGKKFVRGSLIYQWRYNKNQCLDAEVKWLRHMFISTQVNKQWQVKGTGGFFFLACI